MASTTQSSSITSILTIIQVALNALAVIPAVGPDAELASVFLGILQSAMAAYHSAADSALNLTNIPVETPVS
jgi:hypothetical protein